MVFYVYIPLIFLFFTYISIFIFLAGRKVPEALYIGQVITPTCFRRCQDIIVGLKLFFNSYMTLIWNCLPRPPTRGKCRKVSFQGHNRMARVGFEPRPSRSRSRRFYHSTTRLIIQCMGETDCPVLINNCLHFVSCKSGYLARHIYEKLFEKLTSALFWYLYRIDKLNQIDQCPLLKNFKIDVVFFANICFFCWVCDVWLIKSMYINLQFM